MGVSTNNAFPCPEDALFFAYEVIAKPTGPFIVPEGTEAVVLQNGQFSAPYRPGDQVSLRILQDLYTRRANGKLYICRKEQRKPFPWGLGDIVLADGRLCGANGKIHLVTLNAKALVKRFGIGTNTLSEKQAYQAIKPNIIGAIAQRLVLFMNAEPSPGSPDGFPKLLEDLRMQLLCPLMQWGLGTREITINDIITQ